jgi:hypothetical protein
MALKSTVNRYGTMAISLHWLSAILILAAIGATFDHKGRAVLPSPRLRADAYGQIFVTASDALVSRANVRFTS